MCTAQDASRVSEGPSVKPATEPDAMVSTSSLVPTVHAEPPPQRVPPNGDASPPQEQAPQSALQLEHDSSGLHVPSPHVTQAPQSPGQPAQLSVPVH